MQFEKIVGIFAGLLTSISMLPQFIKLIKTKDAQNISKGMLVVLICGVIGWIYYGCLKNDPIIIATNAFALLVNLFTIILCLKYRS